MSDIQDRRREMEVLQAENFHQHMMESDENGKNVEVSIIPSESAGQKTADVKKMFWHIDREMIRFKLHYFLFEAALGSSVPYITIFAKSRIGIAASSLAVILIGQQFLFIFSKPVIGYIADYFNKLKAIIGILSIVQTVFFLLLLSVPKIPKGEKDMFLHNDTLFVFSGENLNSSQLYVNCSSNQDTSPFSDVLCFFNLDNNMFCYISLNCSSQVTDKCSCQDFATNNISNILVINKSTNKSLSHKRETNGISWSSTLNLDLLSTCKVYCKSTRNCQHINCEIPTKIPDEVSSEMKNLNDFGSYQFWLFALLSTIAMGCTNGLFTLSDTACCESVEKTGAQFGRQRMYGAIGWGLLSPVGGLLNDYTNDFTAAWILMAIISIISLWNILRLDLVKPKFSKNLLKDVGAVLRSKQFLAFNLCVFLNGIGTGVIWFYQIWFLTTIGGSRFLCGMVQFVQCIVGEIPFMFFSWWFIKKIGHFNVLTLSLMSYCIRFLWYSYLSNPWLVLPAEALHGFTYGIFYPTVASYAKLSAKPGTEATTQAVLFTAHEGLGAGIGCVVAGYGFDLFGGHETFFILSVFAGCSMILSIILHLCTHGRKGSIDLTSCKSI